MAAHLNLSSGHCHKLFHRWAGLTPKQFQGFLRKEHALAQLRASKPVLEASWAAGLSGSGRLHDLLVHWEAVTPGEYRRLGEGLTLAYRFTSSPLGEFLQVHSHRGLCHLGFVTESRQQALTDAAQRWPAARLVADQKALSPLCLPVAPDQPLVTPLHLWGTPFQHKVWEALLTIPPGHLCTYGALAQALNRPGAARAVGTAVGANPVGVLIPCHRVIQGSGITGGYRWGPERKLLLLAREQLNHSQETSAE
ncbi:methylated-DNA--[protein]-cysteine S-methyltransferase [Marinimicrobium sp. ARAG 43.8]|uniref:methylated-DNA--[protein]-cysteine S-methyltransferase n=1 Tax=Marinimicrobium sp. ARAG 43.8 TaxID=3418719 RepID=UPI003CEDFA73